jgi:asparagine synthase (glutamine-hydrolysing)
MCGIAGYVGGEVPDALEQMIARLAHRGPDQRGFWHDPARRVHFGHARLAIVDQPDGGQPMRTTDGQLVVVFNGEIYNAPELRAQLTARGHRFASGYSDTEVLLHGYREWRHELPGRLNGMWAFVIYDRERNQLFASRDRFGEKPLYYALVDDTLLFGSELGALRQHPACPNESAPLALRKYFAYGYVPAPLTFLKGVWKLPAGHRFVFDLNAKTLSVRKYWEFLLEPDQHLAERSEDELADELLSLLRQAVRRRLAADVKLGVFLSGGIDSSAIAALAVAEQGGAQVDTFTIGFEEATFDESVAARRMARRLGTRHHEATVNPQETRRILPRLMTALDEPLGDPSLVPSYALAELARRRVGVVLGGDGGDELFAGYDTFRALRFAEAYAAFVPACVHPAIAHLCALLPVAHRNLSFDFKVKRFLRGAKLRPALWNPSWLAPTDQAELEALFAAPVDLEEIFSEAIAAWDAVPGGSVIDRSLQFFTRVYLPDDILTKTDRASMLHGLELRSPFLDRDVADFARRLPARLKLRGGCTKYLLKRALRNVLSADTVHRRKKGFGLPIGAWLRAGYFPLSSQCRLAGINPEFLAAAGRQHSAGMRDHRQLLWCAAILAASRLGDSP